MKQDDPLTVVSEFMPPTEKRVIKQTVCTDMITVGSHLGGNWDELEEELMEDPVFLERIQEGRKCIRVVTAAIEWVGVLV